MPVTLSAPAIPEITCKVLGSGSTTTSSTTYVDAGTFSITGDLGNKVIYIIMDIWEVGGGTATGGFYNATGNFVFWNSGAISGADPKRCEVSIRKNMIDPTTHALCYDKIYLTLGVSDIAMPVNVATTFYLKIKSSTGGADTASISWIAYLVG